MNRVDSTRFDGTYITAFYEGGVLLQLKLKEPGAIKWNEHDLQNIEDELAQIRHAIHGPFVVEK